MREPWMLGSGAVAIVMLAVAPVALAADGPHSLRAFVEPAVAAALPLPAAPATPVFLYTGEITRRQSGCAPASHASRFLEWWRQTWGAGVARSNRTDQTEPEKTANTFYYLRSPLLSGFYTRAHESTDCTGGGGRHADTESCALLTLRTDADHARRVEVHLPQLDAHNPRELAVTINQRLEHGTAIDLRRYDGESPRTFRITPGHFREINAESCVPRRPG